MSFRATALLGAMLVLLGPGWPAHALQAPPPPPPGAVDEAPLLTPQQLDDLVASIALYPDPLVAQILAAATYPLEVVEAHRWLQANPGLQGTALTDAAQNQPWDPSVQALVVFPSVLGMLDRNLAWTINLGNAFLAQEQDVMDAMQRQRQRAMDAGLLGSSQQQLVQRSTEANQTVIEILPAQPEVVYVPVYDPVAIWGAPVYHPWPPFWYPPRPVGAIIAAGFVGFFFAVLVARSFHHWGGWSGWGWGVGWHRHTVVVNNTFYTRNNYRLPSNYIRSGPSPWSHDPHHRGGVAYPSRGVAGRVGAPAGRMPLPAPRPGGEGMVITRPSHVEPRPPPPIRSAPGPGPGVPRPPLAQQGRPDRDRTLFGGSSGSGERTRIESDRGHGSLGSRPFPRPAPAPQVRPAPAPQQGRPAPAPQGRPAPGRGPAHR
jgi:Protein of unknown function (DUF3300)